MAFSKNITILVGANGIGKSTLLEGIAAQCGFALTGGTKNIAHRSHETEQLSRHLRLSWLPKVTQGFFFRAETFFQFISEIDVLAQELGGYAAHDPYGGVSMRKKSHGQSFMSMFENRFGHRGLYIVDEPEAALSPARQIDFLKLLRKLDQSGQAQVIMVTHSPLLMTYPNADFLEMTPAGLRRAAFHTIEHFKIMRNFCLNPDGFMDGVMLEADEKDEGQQKISSVSLQLQTKNGESEKH